ncbi:hypothetical protein QBC44DRAFT_399044 [Cladorrhinum sp. PSN332]|nr:hypothetical protein QBC44DRAFT_399044 [Cladorrhinum sp. PSN332]
MLRTPTDDYDDDMLKRSDAKPRKPIKQAKSLADLPDELLLIIYAFMVDIRPRLTNEAFLHARRDLSHLSRSCRRLYNFVTPILYNTVTNSDSRDGVSLNVIKFLRTLAENPNLGLLVREFRPSHYPRLGSLIYDFAPKRAQRFPPTKGDWIRYPPLAHALIATRTGQLFEETLKNSLGPGLPSDPKWLERSRCHYLFEDKGHWDWRNTLDGDWCRRTADPFLLALCLAPKLSKLRITANSHSCSSSMTEQLDLLIPRPCQTPKIQFPFLTCLEVVTVTFHQAIEHYCFDKSHEQNSNYGHGHLKLDLPNIQGLLTAAPSLQSLRLSTVDRVTKPIEMPSGLESLIVTKDASIPASEFSNLVRDCGGLKRFSISYDNSGLRNDPATTGVILQSLKDCGSADTLESLDIYAGPLATKIPGSDDVTAIQGFPALRILGISSRSLKREYGENPLIDLIKHCKALEGLILYEAGCICDEEILKFAHAVANGQFPRLRVVHLAVGRLGTQETRECRRREIVDGAVGQLFAKGNVEIDMPPLNRWRVYPSWASLRIMGFLQLEKELGWKLEKDPAAKFAVEDDWGIVFGETYYDLDDEDWVASEDFEDFENFEDLDDE